MKFLVRVEKPILPPGHVPGSPLPERVTVQIDEYTIDATDERDVARQLEAAKAAGHAHVRGVRIRSIERIQNGAVILPDVAP